MKKITCFMAVVVAFVAIETASAQTFVFGGFNFGYLSTEDEDDYLGSYDSNTGFDVGIAFSKPIGTSNVRIQFAPSVRTHRHTFSGTSYAGYPIELEREINLMRLALPVTAMYDWDINENVTLSGGLGLSFGYSLSGKNKASGYFIGTPVAFDTEYNLEFGTDDEIWYLEEVGFFGQDTYYVFDSSNLRSFDAGIDVRLALTLNNKFVISWSRQSAFTPFYKNGGAEGFLRDTQLSFGILIGGNGDA